MMKAEPTKSARADASSPSGPPGQSPSRPPRPAQGGPLSGRRVLDLCGAEGAYCGKLFADLGADVVKIEPPAGCASRGLAPFAGDRPGPTRGLFFLYTNTNKRSARLDLQDAGARSRFLGFVDAADVVLETFAPGELGRLGLDYATLRTRNPRVVLTSITGFGQSGPRAQWKSSDLVASALGGALHVTGDAEDPPVSVAGSPAFMMASTTAAAASLIALRHADSSGAGQHVDLSMQEVVASVTHVCGAGKILSDGLVPKRFGTGLFSSVPSGAYPCSDGLVYLMVNRPAHWQALARWIHEETGVVEVLDPMFEGPSSVRQPYRELIDLYIGDLTAKHTVDQIYHEGQRRHIAMTPVNRATQILAEPHLSERGFFVDVAHEDLGRVKIPGAPYRPAVTPWAIAKGAPSLGEHDREVMEDPCWFQGVKPTVQGDSASPSAASPDSAAPGAATTSAAVSSDPAPSGAASVAGTSARSRPAPHSGPLSGPQPAPQPGPLDGLRVLEFGAGMAGPWIGRFMAWAGAEVIKVESRARPDVTRLFISPREPELGIQEDASPWFTDWNAGKRSVSIDLTNPRAAELVKRLASRVDVVVENQRAGVMKKLGLDDAALREAREDLVMLSSSGYGESGPYHRYVTWGPNIETLSGMSAMSGFPHRECTMSQYAYPDALSGLHGLVVVMAALDHRRRTGQGQAINMSQLEATMAVIGDRLMESSVNGVEPERLGNSAVNAAPHGCYRCAGEDAGEDTWCAITAMDDGQWLALATAMGRSDLARDPRFVDLASRKEHEADLDAAVSAWTQTRDADAVMSELQDAGVAAGKVQTIEDMLERDPQLAARGYFETIEHRRVGPVVANGIPLGLTGTPGATPWTGGLVGSDNRYVFREVLGLSEEEISEYEDCGAIES